ncbi:Bpu10I family restriction endonuclease [Thermogemmatispora aurantia]|uniref:Bpu10I family restriction endonuclease n=1 Tax=Thermogemmatispora aurantia TaxID=2045279 RepID=A0A5J4K7W3_9CHLR|nr:Bpu10I family restriction endonuclease [Thermogemmatispora aurantia]GER84704.1 Bpu10I family restriction endonuclease [Thermogemmatispora aurantia]
MVNELNEYRLRLDINLIFDSPHDWLYRQKGQTKLDNSIIEEFLPRLVQALLGHKLPAGIRLGPVESFSAIWFDSSLTRREPAGGLSLRQKAQDFALSLPLYIRASHSPTFEEALQLKTNLAYIAAECKTNLDKTMFQEACATARDLKSALPLARYLLLCEWLDMKPINTGTTPIDKVLILRKAKRISALTREKFSTYQGRQSLKGTYLAFLQSHSYREEVFQLFVNYIDQFLSQETLDEATVLDQGYF